MDILWWALFWRLDCQYDGSQNSELCAAVPYYGGQPTAEEAEQIKANHGSMPV
jgi:hypothetical protein